MAELTRRQTGFEQQELFAYPLRGGTSALEPAIRTELVRKSIHMLIALVPTLAAVVGSGITLGLLAGGTTFYTIAEVGRQQGKATVFVSRITSLSTRDRDHGHFVLGPVTLGLGAMLTMFLYPAPVAAIAIYALAFGDGLSSLIGKLIGRVSLFGGRKTLEGSLTCFIAVFGVSLPFVAVPEQAFAIALGATVLEALPTEDFDNLILPLGTGFIATAVFALL